MITAQQARERTNDMIRERTAAHQELRDKINDSIEVAIIHGKFHVTFLRDWLPEPLIDYYRSLGYRVVASLEYGYVKISWQE